MVCVVVRVGIGEKFSDEFVVFGGLDFYCIVFVV